MAHKVLGRRLEFPYIIEEYEEPKLVRFLRDMPNPIPRAHQTSRYTDLGDDRLRLDVVDGGGNDHFDECSISAAASMGERNTGRRELGFLVEEVAGAEVHRVGEG